MKNTTKILVVEDNIRILKEVVRLLGSSGYEVKEATTGNECLQMIAADKPDIVLLDVYLPDTFGYDVCRHIKSTPGFDDVSVIYLSSTPATDEMKTTGFDVGADDYIVRPVSDKELLARIRAMERMHRTEKRLRESEERYRIAIECSNDGVAIIKNDLYRYVNQRFVRMFGFAGAEDVVGNHVNCIAHDEDRERLTGEIGNWESALQEPRLHEFKVVRKDGVSLYIEVSMTHMTYDGELVVLALLRDVTERKQAEETIRQLAYYDALTGLPNRILLNDRLTMALAQAQRAGRKLAVMMLDLDKFKEVNDTLGHAAGDTLLKAVADRLTGALRKHDTVSRLGGDEFIVVIPEVMNKDDLAILAGKILDVIRSPVTIDGHRVAVGSSMGIAIYPDNGVDIETLMQHADYAMYRAKQSGRNQYRIFTEDLS
ncbi:MAG TPA: diguanylate cyclase [Syntrophorhabdaceae bacterium]|nr:diguanylate cyclase [Syntrophorhabdaceae bacterium]HQM80122.1 diguanylate cyclase [Syntrophorhabdaceae bacterium]